MYISIDFHPMHTYYIYIHACMITHYICIDTSMVIILYLIKNNNCHACMILHSSLYRSLKCTTTSTVLAKIVTRLYTKSVHAHLEFTAYHLVPEVYLNVFNYMIYMYSIPCMNDTRLKLKIYRLNVMHACKQLSCLSQY